MNQNMLFSDLITSITFVAYYYDLENYDKKLQESWKDLQKKVSNTVKVSDINKVKFFIIETQIELERIKVTIFAVFDHIPRST